MSGRRMSVRALGVPDYRAYWAGQFVANTGLWFQNLSISLLVVQLTGSASALALVTVCHFGPVLLLSAWAGRLVDTIPPRTVLLGAAGGLAAVAVGLAFAVAPAEPSLPLVFGLVVVAGAIGAFERAAAQAMVYELVGRELLQSGVVLGTVQLSAARSIGPGLAGVAFLGLGPMSCLLITAACYLVEVAALLAIRPARLVARPIAASTSVLDNLRAVAANRALVVILLVNLFVTIGAMNFNVVLTAVVSIEFRGDAGALGAAHALNAVGAVVGALAVTLLRSVRPIVLAPACLLFGISLAVNAAAPTLGILLLAAPLLGIGIGAYTSVLTSAAQGSTPPDAIGRTMSLVTMGNVGVAPFGAVLVGLLIDATNGHVALGVGALVCVLCAGLVALAVPRTGPTAAEARS